MVEERSYATNDRFLRALLISLCRAMGLTPMAKTRKATSPIYVVASAEQHDVLTARLDTLGPQLDARLTDVATDFIRQHGGKDATR